MIVVAVGSHSSATFEHSWPWLAEKHAGAGANLLANVWGPVIGAKVVRYRTAVVLGIACQIVGIVVFGPRTATVYNGILYDWTKLKPYPELTLYALAWTEITLVIWQYLAIWKQILIPVYLGAGNAQRHPEGPCVYLHRQPCTACTSSLHA